MPAHRLHANVHVRRSTLCSESRMTPHMNRALEQFSDRRPHHAASVLNAHDCERTDDDFIRLLKVKAGLEHAQEPPTRSVGSPRLAPEDLHLAERQAERRGLGLEQYARELFHLAVHAEETLLDAEPELL